MDTLSENETGKLYEMVKALQEELQVLKANMQPVKPTAQMKCAENNKVPEEWHVKKQLREMTGTIKKHDFVIRTQTRMLMKLYEHREYGLKPKLLFSYAGVKGRTAYRHVAMLKDNKYVTFIGARQEGKYILTGLGAKMMTEADSK